MALRQEDVAGGAVVYVFPDRGRATRHAPPLRRWARARVRRRRLAAILLVAVAVLGSRLGGDAPRHASARSGRPVVVEGGDTLWDIARRHAGPGTDVRAYLDALIRLNGIESSIVPGQRLWLPLTS